MARKQRVLSRTEKALKWIDRHRRWLLLASVSALLVLGMFLRTQGWRWHDWTGFETYKEGQRTLWDWLELLIVPVVLAVGVYFLNRTERLAERTIATERAELERKLAEDRNQENLLQIYLDRMSELLLDRDLRSSDPDAEPHTLARTRTSAVLQQLTGYRKAIVLRFLSESRLLDKEGILFAVRTADLNGLDVSGVQLSALDLRGAGLSEAKLRQANLRQADLSRASLSKADLSRADLTGAILFEASLERANLSGAILRGVNLEHADLHDAFAHRADLQTANLRRANLTGVVLRAADLSHANIMEASLHGADLRRAKLPNGEQFDENKHTAQWFKSEFNALR